MSLTISGVTTLRYCALRFAEELGLDTDENRYFLLEFGTLKPYGPDELAADYDGTVFVLGCEPLGRSGTQFASA